MAERLIPILVGALASALILGPALADGPSKTGGTTPQTGWALPVPQNGWALPVPPTGWGGMPPTRSTMMGNDNGDHGDHHHRGPMIVTWPYGYYSPGYGTTGSQPIVINVEAPQQPAPPPAGPPPPVPGIDTHPTVEETPSGVEIVRGPGSS